MRLIRTGIALSALLCLYALPAASQLITSPGDLVGPVTVIDFEQFSGTGYNFTFGPVDLGSGVTFTATPTNGGNSGQGSIVGEGSYGLASNGDWGLNGQSYSGLDADTGCMFFTFASPISGVGGLMNYIPDAGFTAVTIAALGAGNVVLEEHTLNTEAPISTPGGQNAGEFRGIQRAQADIQAFRICNGYAVLDDLTFTATQVAVPEPGALALLLGAGLPGTLLLLRRKRA